MSRARPVLGSACGSRAVCGRRRVVALASLVVAGRYRRCWRLLVRRLFALASVWGLVVSVAGLWNSVVCVALRAEKYKSYEHPQV